MNYFPYLFRFLSLLWIRLNVRVYKCAFLESGLLRFCFYNWPTKQNIILENEATFYIDIFYPDLSVSFIFLDPL